MMHPVTTAARVRAFCCRTSRNKPTAMAFRVCRQYQRLERPRLYCSVRSPRMTSVSGLHPNCLNNHVAIRGGSVDLTRCLLPIPAIHAIASRKHVASLVLPSVPVPLLGSIVLPVPHAPVSLHQARKLRSLCPPAVPVLRTRSQSPCLGQFVSPIPLK